MHSLDLVLRRTPTNLKANLSKLVIAGATAAALVLTPTLTTIAAPAAPSATLANMHNESPKIVPATGPGSDEDPDEEQFANNDDDIDESEDRDTDEQDDDSFEEFDEEDVDEESELPAPIAIEGIIPSHVDLNWNQWTGAMDSRLVAPFISLPRPVELTSDAIGLDADITVREIIGGEMQTPADEFEVSWYKETGNPGERKTNMVFAGHLNWYNTPEAVFHNIDELEEGDEIVVTAEDGSEYTYVVKWVKLVETANADMEEIVGPTKKTSLTLITCGGEWDPNVSQYKQRTVVRAEIKR